MKATVEASSNAINMMSVLAENTDKNVAKMGSYLLDSMDKTLRNDEEASNKLDEILTRVKPVDDASQSSIEKVNRKVNGVSSNVRTLTEKVGQLTTKIDRIFDALAEQSDEPAQ